MRSPTARDAAEGLAEIEAEDARVQAALRVWREIHDTANVDDDPEDLDYAAMDFALAEADKLRTDVLLPGHVPMPRTADEAKAMWLLGERWIRDNASEMIRSVGTDGGETQGEIPEEHLCPTGETFAEDEVRGHLHAEVEQAGGVDAWAAAACVSRHGAADFLAGEPLVSHRLMNAIGFEPVTVYRPITEAGRRALHARTTDGGEA